MSRVDALIRQYRQFVSLPWEHGLSGVQRVWFAVYPKEDERRIRARIGEFELATREARHGWHLVDLTGAFAHWMASHEYREEYFEEPDYLDMSLNNFHAHLCDQIRKTLRDPAAGEDAVVALMGVACLFGFTRVSRLIRDLEDDIQGRLLVFFPGEYENNNYRLLDARDGWNYMAVPITAHTGVGQGC